MPGHRDDRIHVEGVEIRAFLAVDLDVDEALVHQRRRLLVLERLVRHHVAPVAGGVADAQQNRLVFALCFLERIGSPGKPIDGVLGVLQQVRTGFPGEAIGHG